MMDVEPDDPQMLAAIEKSRATFPEFLATYQANDLTMQDFAIKVLFPAGERAEHIWVTVIQITPDKILGVVNNEPELTEAVAFGETVEINSQTISDWNYIKGNKLYGGYSIRLLRNRITPALFRESDDTLLGSFFLTHCQKKVASLGKCI